MERLYIGKTGVVYGTGATGIGDLEDLAEGAVAILLDDTGLILAADGLQTPTADSIKVAVGMPAGSATKVSPSINLATASLSTQAYVAPVAMVADFGDVVVGTKTIGAEYGFEIVDLSKEVWERRAYNISTTLTDASTTDAVMLDNLVALFNAHPDAPLVASVVDGTTKLTFTSLTGTRFAIRGTGLLMSSPFTVTTEPTIGVGTNAQILDAEAKASAIEGRTATGQTDQLGDIWKVPSVVETGVNYVTHVLEWSDQRSVAYPSNNANPSIKRVVIAVPTGDASVTALANCFDDLGLV